MQFSKRNAYSTHIQNCFVIPTIWLLFYCYHKFEQLKCLWDEMHAQISQNAFDWSAWCCWVSEIERACMHYTLSNKRNLKSFFVPAHNDEHYNFFQLYSMPIVFDSFSTNIYTLTITELQSLIIYTIIFFIHLVCKSFRIKIKKNWQTEKKNAEGMGLNRKRLKMSILKVLHLWWISYASFLWFSLETEFPCNWLKFSAAKTLLHHKKCSIYLKKECSIYLKKASLRTFCLRITGISRVPPKILFNPRNHS